MLFCPFPHLCPRLRPFQVGISSNHVQNAGRTAKDEPEDHQVRTADRHDQHGRISPVPQRRAPLLGTNPQHAAGRWWSFHDRVCYYIDFILLLLLSIQSSRPISNYELASSDTLDTISLCKAHPSTMHNDKSAVFSTLYKTIKTLKKKNVKTHWKKAP